MLEALGVGSAVCVGVAVVDVVVLVEVVVPLLRVEAHPVPVLVR